MKSLATPTASTACIEEASTDESQEQQGFFYEASSNPAL